MKKLLLVFILGVSLIACGKQEPNKIKSSQLEQRGNMYYEVNEKKPYTGIVVGYYENGNMKIEANFKNGKMDGKSTIYYENGKVKSEENHKENILDGEQIKYYDNGKMEVKAVYQDGEFRGDIRRSKEGYNLVKLQKLEDRDDVLYEMNTESLFTGVAYTLYSNGKYKETWKYKDGKREGEAIGYYENGQIDIKTNFVNGIPHGKFIGYSKNGNINLDVNYKNGKPHGEAIEYYSNGQVKSKGTFKNGKPHGEAIEYYSNGNIRRKQYFKNGKQIR